MGGLYRATTSDGDYQDYGIPSWGDYYLTESGKLLPVQGRICWCESCQSIVRGELLATELSVYRHHIHQKIGFLTDEECQRIMADHDKRTRLLKRLTAGDPDHEIFHDLVMVASRQSPPRCLTCGSFDLRYADENNIIQRPDEKSITLEWVGHAEIWGADWLFSTEGERLRESDRYGMR